jgi:hypothetical protein
MLQYESQTGPGRRHHRDRAQDRHHLLHHVSKQVEYDASLWAQRDQLREKRLEATLRKQAAERGYKLVPIDANKAA